MGEHRYFESTSGETRLFQRGADPHELRNLIAERPDLAAAGRAGLGAWLLSTPQAPAPAEPPGWQTADPEALENLRALGYIQ